MKEDSSRSTPGFLLRRLARQLSAIWYCCRRSTRKCSRLLPNEANGANGEPVALHVTPQERMLLHVTFFGRIDCESSPCQERCAHPGCPTCAEAPQGIARRGPSSHPDLGPRC